ncbi:MAG TPA: CHRD domain-containing protein [Ilumatobacteraceae bacterium]
MASKRAFALTAVGLAAAVAIPTVAFGNARPNPTAQTNTPLVARMTGAQEVPNSTPGAQTQDPDGLGSAAVTFDLGATPADVCWDLTYTGLTGTPIAAHIHGPAAPGVTAPVVIGFTPFTTLTPTGASSCRNLTAGEATIAADIVAHPENYYVNVHTTDFPGGAIRGQLSTGAAPAGAVHLLPTPLRAYDSRLNAGPKIQPGETRTINLNSGFLLNSPTVNTPAVPAGATAAIITLTVAETNAPGGFLTIYSAASTQPATSSINWKAADQDIAVGTQVAVDPNGNIKVTDGVNTAPTHFIIDVVGYLY